MIKYQTMKSKTKIGLIAISVIFLSFLMTCEREVLIPSEIPQVDSTDTNQSNVAVGTHQHTNLFTVERIKKMIHEAVAEHPDFSYNETNNTYIFTDWDYSEIFSATNITDMIYLIAGLGIDDDIDLSNLSSQAEMYYYDFMGIDKGIYYEPGDRNKTDIRWYYPFYGHYFVPYYFINLNAEQERYVRNAMRVIEKDTRVRFVEDTHNYRTQTPILGLGNVQFPITYTIESPAVGEEPQGETREVTKQRLKIEAKTLPNGGGLAYLQRVNGGAVFLDPASGFTQSIVLHELLHCISIAHEHQRSDRGDHFVGVPSEDPDNIGVRPERVRDSKGCWKRMYYYYGNFDIASIMNYALAGWTYAYTNLNIHIKQPRFQFNLTDGIPIIALSTEADANREVGITLQLNNSLLSNLLQDLDRNDIDYTNVYGSLILNSSFFGNDYFPSDLLTTHPHLSETLIKLIYVLDKYLGYSNESTTLIRNVNNNQGLYFGRNWTSFYEFDSRLALFSDIININPHVPPTNVPADPTDFTYDQLVEFYNSVHFKNYRLIADYIIARTQGSSSFDSFSRVEYFWTAPVRQGQQVILTHFLSEGDIATIQQVTH